MVLQGVVLWISLAEWSVRRLAWLLWLAQGAKTNWWYSIWNLPNIAALLLFVAAFLLLYVQQLRSHAELEVAHAKLKISTERIEELTRLTERQRLARALHDTLAPATGSR
jgi:hypothetical protein